MVGDIAANVSEEDYRGIFIAGEVIVYIRKFLICPVGVACNILALIIFYRQPLKQSNITAYLVVMAMADSVYLLSDTINHIVKLTSATTTLYCNLTHYFAMVSSTCSDALVAAVAVHRAVAVSLPHKIKVIMTTRNSFISIGVCFFLANGLYIHTFWLYIYDENSGWCLKIHNVIEQVDALILLCRSLIILFVIVVSSIIIVIRLRQQRRLRDVMTSGVDNGSEQRDAQIGTLLLSISLLYLTTSLPLAVFLLVQSIFPWQDIDPFHANVSELMFIILYTLKNFNNVLNFFIYCQTATGFREELKNFCKYKCRCFCHCKCRKRIYVVGT